MQTATHILVIRLSAMGDVAMAVPVLRAFTEQHPNCKITMLSKPFLKPLFEDIPNVSFFAVDVNQKHKGFFGLFRLFKELKKEGITHVADFHNVLRSKILRTFFKFGGTSTKHIDKGRAEKKALTRSKNKIFKQLKTSHQRYADVLKKLGFDVDIENPTGLKKLEFSKKLSTLTGVKENQWIGIAPFATSQGKVYPLHFMEEVIAELSSKGLTIFLFGGGESEIQLLNALEKKYENTINIAGKISFQEELQLIHSLDLMLSMDSGNAHLAAMLHVKTITLWGVTHPFAGFAPYNQPSDYCMLPDLARFPKIPCSIYGNKIAEGYEKAMETIPPNEVVDKVMAVLKA